MSSDSNGLEMIEAFTVAAANEEIVASRYEVLESASVAFSRMADELQVAGYFSNNDRLRAAALLVHLASELSNGISILLRAQREYPAGALLRQLIEVEYLAFQAYADSSQLEGWYGADAVSLRRQFTPKAMRKASGGVFRDQEYWHHCELGGHPHPRARILLRKYASCLSPDVFLLPDSVHHVRRLWTSIRLLMPQLDGGNGSLERHTKGLTSALENWQRVEHPSILARDGIGR
ncbi:hypothetical protein ACYT85_17245 [Ralstonia solanacearum]|uniref:hypothetical protein n=1 Tax=Ralstonia solanacearum TaxID=305 RepID=UPI0018D0EC2C|nr:hypothetical protein [Ralstonia solanacearum]